MIRTILLFVTGILIACALRPAEASFVVGTFDSTRSSTANPITGLFTSDAITSLNANFPGTTFVAAPTLTPAFLAGVDVLFIGSADTDAIGIAPLSVAEQTALFDFVQAGGRGFLVVDGFSPFIAAAQSMVAPFGMTIVDDGLTGVLGVTPTTPAHPVIDGPYGDTTAIPMFGAGVFTNLGPYATTLATLNATGQPVLAAIEAQALGPNSGRVVMITDSHPFVDAALGGGFALNETLFLNTFEYLRVPEPGGQTLAALGAGGIGLAAIFGARRRRRRRLRDRVARQAIA
jgi:hypothetical protein